MSATIKYALQRAVLFIAPFAILMIAQVPWYISLVIALVFAFCASYIFLRGSRDAAVAEIARARPRKGADETAEDVDDEDDLAADDLAADDLDEDADATSDAADDDDADAEADAATEAATATAADADADDASLSDDAEATASDDDGAAARQDDDPEVDAASR